MASRTAGSIRRPLTIQRCEASTVLIVVVQPGSTFRKRKAIGRRTYSKPIHFSSSSLLYLGFLSPHPLADSHRPLAPPNIIAFIRPGWGGGGEPGGDLRVVRKRRFQKQVSKSLCSTHQTPSYFDIFLMVSCDFFAFVLSEINDASIRNPPWYLDEETRRRWWTGAPWRLRLGECVPLF